MLDQPVRSPQPGLFRSEGGALFDRVAILSVEFFPIQSKLYEWHVLGIL